MKERIRKWPEKVDIADAYDVFKSMKGTYVICFDIADLTYINAFQVLRDLAIIETAKRIDEAREDDMLMFRIGGDEFALVTGWKTSMMSSCSQRKSFEKR